MDQSKLKELAIELFDLKVLKFGGTNSPFYFDTQALISDPNVMVSL